MSLYIYGIPAIALAQTTGNGATVESLLQSISTTIINPLINFLLVLATMVFLWGVIQYVIAGESADKAQKARNQIVWGLVGLAIMAGAKGIVDIIENSIGIL